jgi:hypothetical protein
MGRRRAQWHPGLIASCTPLTVVEWVAALCGLVLVALFVASGFDEWGYALVAAFAFAGVAFPWPSKDKH